MSKQQLRKEITELINTIKEQSDNLTGKEPMSQLELEIILSKIKKLYEKSVIFNYLHVTQKVEMMVDEKTLVSEAASYLNSGVISPVAPVIEKNKETPSPAIQHDVPLKTSSPTVENSQEKITVKINTPATKPDANFINSSKSSLPNFEKLMGLNDRLLFTKELFNGNPEALNDAVKKINKTSILSDAETILSELKVINNWQNKEAIENFTSMVKRRF